MKNTLVSLSLVILGGACTPHPATVLVPATVFQLPAIIPVPTTLKLNPSQSFIIDTTFRVSVDEGSSPAVIDVARYVTRMLGISADPITRRANDGAERRRGIHLSLDATQGSLGDEGYNLDIDVGYVELVSRTPAGLFHGVQTLRQLLPVSVENPAAIGRKLRLNTGHITDAPRFEWRGMMLDVSRHFIPAADVKRFIDAMALYKLNRLHLHLADDQGWRIEITSRPRLTEIGGSTQVGGGSGGFYTQDEYRDIVAYAASRFITVVPEIDMPAHTNAALASYPELNCDKIAPPLYTGIKVGFSALCVDSAAVLPFVQDVVREISAMTPGNYFHIGGDEVKKLTHAQYIRFIESVQQVVNANGKRMIGWGEISPAALVPGTIVQNWIKDSSFVHAARGGKIIMSPSPRAYLDMKYDSTTVLGLNWAAYIEVKDAYDWDPATFIPGVPEASILGVEGPLWSETVMKREDYEFLAFPRLIALAEVGWSQNQQVKWDDFRMRLGAHAKRQSALGLNFYRSPQVPWLH